MLDELRNSDGYVAEKRFKKHEDLFADPSQLGREERALQVSVELALQVSHNSQLLSHPNRTPVRKFEGKPFDIACLLAV